LLSVTACRTAIFFLFDFSYKRGVMTFGAVPFIQLDDQKRAVLPSPMVTIVDA
jgi:hypothetical protein